MSSLKLVEANYLEDESEQSCDEIILTNIAEPEPIEKEYLDFAEKVMQDHGDSPEKIAKELDIRISNILGGVNADMSREAIKRRLAEVFKVRTLEPWEEIGFGD